MISSENAIRARRRLTNKIIASGLELLGTGATFTLGSAYNAVNTLAGNTGSVGFSNSTTLAVGTVGSSVGIAGSGNITLNAQSGNLTLNQTVNAGANAVRLQANAGSVTQTAPGVITAGSLGVNAGTGI